VGGWAGGFIASQKHIPLPKNKKNFTATIRATKRAVEMYFIQGSCNREISQFIIATLASP